MTELTGMNVAALASFLEKNDVPLRGILDVEMISGGKSNLTYKVTDGSTSWVVRRPPTSGLTPSAHDMAREWTVTHALQDSAVPVARTIAFDADGTTLGAPMTVMGFGDGRVVRSVADLDRLSDSEISSVTAELIRVLSRLHQVDHESVGLVAFGRPTGFVARQVATWARQWDRVKTRELPDVMRLHSALQSAIPATSAATIVHGDYRVDNVILDHDNVDSISAVVDWEMSTLGDPLTDVALMCAYRQPMFDVVLGMNAAWTSDRFPSADQLAQQYASESGRDLSHWEFYTALANFKLAVISEGIAHRAHTGHVAAGDQAGDQLSGAGAAEATREFIAAGLHALR